MGGTYEVKKGLFDTFMATSATGTCGIGGGSMSCTGPAKSLVSTVGGQRTVETYAPQSAENWMEDYGMGAMDRGVGVVQIDPTFAETITADASYHVFLTPRGDSPGHLFVTNVTASSFEVRESGGGTSSIGFDYKIVAKRRGYEAQRLVDVTDRFNAEKAQSQRRVPKADGVVASKAYVEPQMVEHPESLARAAALRTAMPGMRPGGGSALPATPAVVPGSAGSSLKPAAKSVPEK
jgi:hypothetical protein